MGNYISFFHVMTLDIYPMSDEEYNEMRSKYLKYINASSRLKTVRVVSSSSNFILIVSKLLVISFFNCTLSILFANSTTATSDGVVKQLFSLAIIVSKNIYAISNSNMEINFFSLWRRKKKVIPPPVDASLIQSALAWVGENLKAIAVGLAAYPNLKAISNVLYTVGEFLMNPSRTYSIWNAIYYSYKLVLEEVLYIIKSPMTLLKGISVALQRYLKGGKFLGR